MDQLFAIQHGQYEDFQSEIGHGRTEHWKIHKAHFLMDFVRKSIKNDASESRHLITGAFFAIFFFSQRIVYCKENLMRNYCTIEQFFNTLWLGLKKRMHAHLR